MIEDEIISIWQQRLFTFGTNVVTVQWLVIFVASLVALFFLAALVKWVLVKRIFVRYKLNMGVAYSTATIIKYIVIIIGLGVILQTSGLDMRAFGILFGALGIGIGFGLQGISNNFISGIIILFERPVKVGDRVEVEGIAGTIQRISARATTIITNDDIAIIVPNSEIINKNVINWSLKDSQVRFNFLVRVDYNEDPERVRLLLLDVAHHCDGVVQDPPPDVLLDEFGDIALVFNLRVWSTEYCYRPRMLKSMLYFDILKRFKEENIKIPLAPVAMPLPASPPLPNPTAALGAPLAEVN